MKDRYAERKERKTKREAGRKQSDRQGYRNSGRQKDSGTEKESDRQTGRKLVGSEASRETDVIAAAYCNETSTPDSQPCRRLLENALSAAEKA